MIHPFLNSKKAFGYFILVWAIVMMAHLFVLSFYYQLPINIAFADAIIFNSIFALFSLSIWYVIKYVVPVKYKNTSIFINHLTSASLLILFWLYLSNQIVQIFINEQQNYMSFSDKSIPIRVLIGIFYYLLTISVYYLIIYYNDLQEKTIEESRLKELVAQTELSLLKSQINPHFLFNSLNSISSLTLIEPSKAQEMVIKLSDFLRHTITNQAEQFIPLEKELEQVKRYLEIEEIRFSDKLNLKWSIMDLNSTIVIPTMILQPIYENAIKHGLYDAANMVSIQTQGLVKKNYYLLTISNSYEERSLQKSGTKVGLKNIKERLRIIYGSDSILMINDENNLFTITLHIPYTNNINDTSI